MAQRVADLRILLINTNRKGDLLAAPPLGLCYVAGAAEAAGHEVRMLDLCFAANNLRKLFSRNIRSFEPQIIGLSIRNVDNVNMLHPVSYLPEIVRITGYIREITSVPLVVGGSGASLMPANVLKLLGADFIVVADGEDSFARLIKAIETGDSTDNIPGVGRMIAGKFHLTEPRLAKFNSGSPDADSTVFTARTISPWKATACVFARRSTWWTRLKKLFSSIIPRPSSSLI